MSIPTEVSTPVAPNATPTLPVGYEKMLEALREIAAMPAYSMPVPEHYLSSLIKRYHRALTLAENAVAKATGAI